MSNGNVVPDGITSRSVQYVVQMLSVHSQPCTRTDLRVSAQMQQVITCMHACLPSFMG